MAGFSSFGKGVVLQTIDEGDKERICTIHGDVIYEKGRKKDPKYKYQGFWYLLQSGVEGIMWVQQHFKPRNEDVLLVSFPKCGTTWFKSLLFSTMNRNQHDFSNHPLFTASPHELVPYLELYLSQNIPFPNPDSISPPHLFHTHIPFTSLPQSLTESPCRIVYLCRNPKDVFVSTFFFEDKVMAKKCKASVSILEAFDLFCEGVSIYGPYWDHMLGYWKASLDWPERVLFMRYEDMQRDPSFHLKKLAEFMGCPFSSEEETQGLVHQIVNLCSFQNLSNFKANKIGALSLLGVTFETDTFFRKGEIGDWKNHLTPDMADRLDSIIEEKLAGSGLTFSHS